MFYIFLLVTALFTTPAWAQSQAKLQGVVINAKELFRDSVKGIVQLDGDVQVVFQNQHLSCDHALVHLNTKEVEATGHVVFVTPTATIHGDKVVMNYEKNVGTIYEGYVVSGQVVFEGDVIHKTGEKEYVAVGGKYTTCTTCPPGWSFSGSQIKATLGGYAHINNTLLRFGNVPVFWLPYLVVPLKSTRQTGLLTPELEFSTVSGLTVSQPLFWAMSRSQDSTWTLKNYEYRGAKGLLNYRYRLSELSGGEFNGALLNDRVFKTDPRLDDYRPQSEKGRDFLRWFYRYEHYYLLPEGFVQRASINRASDLQYPMDFERETLNKGQPAMENRISLTRNQDFFHWSVDTSYYQNMLQSNPLAGNRDSVHRLPEIRLATTEQRIADSDFLYNLDVDYTNFVRSGPAYDNLAFADPASPYAGQKHVTNCDPADPTCKTQAYFDNTPGLSPFYDGKFDSTDAIRAGQRLDMTPSISRPFSLGRYLEVMPRLSYRETQYQFPIDRVYTSDGPTSLPGVTRRYVRGDISFRTTGSSVFGNKDEVTATRYKHEIQPEIAYTNIPWLSLPEHPFFGGANSSEVPFFRRNTVSDADIDSPYGLQFDGRDRIYNRNLVTFILNNKLTRKRWTAGEPIYKQILLFRASQSYDAQLASRGSTRPWSPTELLFDLRLENVTSLMKVLYYGYQNTATYESDGVINSDAGSFVGLNYYKGYEFKDEDLNLERKTETIAPRFGFNTKYLTWYTSFKYDLNPAPLNRDTPREKKSSTFKGWQNLFFIRPPGNCWTIALSHETKYTTGIQDGIEEEKTEDVYGINFEFVFDGVKPTSLSTSALKKYGGQGN